MTMAYVGRAAGCGCVRSLMVDDLYTTPSDIKRFYATAAEYQRTVTREPLDSIDHAQCKAHAVPKQAAMFGDMK